MTWADVFWNWRIERQRTLKIHCPACGGPACRAEFDATTAKVKRACKRCGCTVTQPPVAPDLFKNK